MHNILKRISIIQFQYIVYLHTCFYIRCTPRVCLSVIKITKLMYSSSSWLFGFVHLLFFFFVILFYLFCSFILIQTNLCLQMFLYNYHLENDKIRNSFFSSRYFVAVCGLCTFTNAKQNNDPQKCKCILFIFEEDCKTLQVQLFYYVWRLSDNIFQIIIALLYTYLPPTCTYFMYISWYTINTRHFLAA